MRTVIYFSSANTGMQPAWTLLELPAGTLDEKEAPWHAPAVKFAKRQAWQQARTGTSWAGSIFAPGYSTEYMHVYLATDLHPDPLEADADEFLTVERYPLAEALTMFENGKSRTESHWQPFSWLVNTWKNERFYAIFIGDKSL